MKLVLRSLCLLLTLALALATAACTPETTADASSAASAGEKAASEAGQTELPLKDDRGYVIVRNMIDHLHLSFSEDASACFPEDAAGYIIEGGPYFLDAATLLRVIKAPCEGDGSVRWISYKEAGFDGTITPAQMKDPVYLSMNLPGDVRTYYLNPGTAGILNRVQEKHTNILSIGAIYRNEDNPPPDDMNITLCFRDIRLLLHTQEKGWFVADEAPVPSDGMVNSIYFLPWGHKPASENLPDSRVNQFDDHTEVKLTGADLNAANQEDTEEAVLHFWGRTKMFNDLGITWDEIDGVLVSYYVWVKEPEAVGHLTATIGADLREKVGGATDQVFTGHNYLVTTQPTNVIGHNVVTSNYARIMDIDKVKKLLGLN